ncbi:MAG: Ig-like domain-containing protein [Chloroflexota bacterium]
MRTVKKIVLLLMTAIPVFLSLPAQVVLAQGTTVEVNNGNPITLRVGQTITASDESGIPIAVKNLPAIGAPANGLAAFTFIFAWDKNVINVISARPATAAGWNMLVPGTANNTAGTLKSAGFTTMYSTDDVILLYLGITAVGNVGDSTSISVTISALGDRDAQPIAATPVNAPVKISGAKLVSIGVTPADQSVSSGASRQFTAMGTYDDTSVNNITGIAAWTSSNEAIATIQTTGKVNPGLATGLASGAITITATIGTTSASTTLTVTKAEEKPVTSPPGQTTVTPTPTPPANPTPLASMNWWRIGIIAAGVVILGLVSYLLLRMRSGD